MPFTGSPARIRSIYRGTARPLYFANLTPPKIKGNDDPFDGIVTVLRIGMVIGEIALSLLFPKIAPFIAIGGSAIHQAIDTQQFAQIKNPTLSSKLLFGAGTLMNIAPIAFIGRRLMKTSKNVLQMNDGVGDARYIVRGRHKEYDHLFQAWDAGQNIFEAGGLKMVSIATQNRLIASGRIPKQFVLQKKADFDKVLGKMFSPGKGGTGFGKMWQGGYGTKVRYSAKKGYIYTNRDWAIIENLIEKRAKNKITMPDILEKVRKSLGLQAKGALDIGKIDKWWLWYKYGPNINLKPLNSLLKNQKVIWRTDFIKKEFAAKIEKLADLYYASFLAKPLVQSRSGIRKFFDWFAGQRGIFFTQLGQLPNPNDFARELLRQPQKALLDGSFRIPIAFGRTAEGKLAVTKWFYPLGKKFKKIGGLRGWARSVQKASKTIQKVKRITKNVYRHYDMINKQLKKVGVVTQSQEFLMGWRVIYAERFGSTVQMFFNPINTRAKTPGSFNFAGKPSLTTVVSNRFLRILATDPHPGKLYLKGGRGYSPIARSAGGRKRHFLFLSQAFSLLSLYFPLGALRNILSLASNTKQVIVKSAKGTFLPTWKYTFKNTLERLWINRVTRIIGQTAGNILSSEMGMHTSRILKNVSQGFQRKKSETVMVNGKKVRFQRTVIDFSKPYRAQTVYKEALLTTTRSVALRRVRRGTSVKNRLKNRRQGAALRRTGRLLGEWS